MILIYLLMYERVCVKYFFSGPLSYGDDDGVCRKVEVLRVCLGQRDGQLWLRQMNGCNLDFKIVEQRKTEEVEEELTHYIYNTSEGPMWCVRPPALPPTPSSTDLDSIFSHNNALMLGIHHSLADGFTNINICNLVHTILDDMVAGRPVNDEQQVGKLVGDEQTQKLYEEQRQKLLGDPELKERVRKEFQDGADTRPLFLDAFSFFRTNRCENLWIFYNPNGTPDSYYTISNMGDVTPLFTG
nr:uncharacterized protein LOC128705159 [Cherax quadricarinatus]